MNSGEYKLMGLAPYGKPRYADLIRERLVRIKDDGSFWMDMAYFQYCDGLTMTSRKFDALFGGPPRTPESPITEREMDLAASIQDVTEEIMLKAARHVHRVTGMKRLCLAGGVALNCVGNGRVLREGPFDDLWIQPAAGDAGGALGVALYIWHELLGRPREPRRADSMNGAWLGPRFERYGDSRAAGSEGHAVHAAADRRGALRIRRRSPRARISSSAGSRDGWSSVRARSARAASSATRAVRSCSR